jgi:hypothetical protein
MEHCTSANHNSKRLDMDALLKIVREYEEQKPRIILNEFIPEGQILKFGMDELNALAMSPLTLEKLKASDRTIISRFKII